LLGVGQECPVKQAHSADPEFVVLAYQIESSAIRSQQGHPPYRRTERPSRKDEVFEGFAEIGFAVD
jgi:hypothetical protein